MREWDSFFRLISSFKFIFLHRNKTDYIKKKKKKKKKKKPLLIFSSCRRVNAVQCTGKPNKGLLWFSATTKIVPPVWKTTYRGTVSSHTCRQGFIIFELNGLGFFFFYYSEQLNLWQALKKKKTHRTNELCSETQDLTETKTCKKLIKSRMCLNKKEGGGRNLSKCVCFSFTPDVRSVTQDVNWCSAWLRDWR